MLKEELLQVKEELGITEDIGEQIEVIISDYCAARNIPISQVGRIVMDHFDITDNIHLFLFYVPEENIATILDLGDELIVSWYVDIHGTSKDNRN